MAGMASPIFPEESLTYAGWLENEGGDALVPSLPENPLVKNSSLEVYVVPTEDTLFVQGFKPVEYELRPPCLLRGLLVLRVLRTTKIKSITLNFKGTMKTDWPEGIPPKRNVYEETKDLVQHSWPFFQIEANPEGHGANIFVQKKGSDDAIHLALDTVKSNLSSIHSPSALESASSFAASLIRRTTSPVGNLQSPSLTPVTSHSDLNSVMSGSGDGGKLGSFLPGDYVYNFEHLIPALYPESIRATFGTVNYYLEASVSRQGKFKPVLKGKLPVTIVRVPLENSVEENEPIVIERDWEDHLRYEIIVASKSVVLDSYLPLSFKFIPLHGKVALHRIRVFITEECNYYCQNKKVHRSEPSRKFLLLEHKASKSESLLNKDGKVDDSPESTAEVLPRDLEFQMFVPKTINKKFQFQIHPDTAVESIQCTHWIKICLRLSRPNPENGGKRKHFEISIDSPIHMYSSLAAHNNTLLPIYEREPEFLPQYAEDTPLSPGVTAIDATDSDLHLNSHFSSCNLLLMPLEPSAIEFQHIVSPSNIGYAEIDGDIHLDSNLYKPEGESVLSKIATPQAMAYSPLASPTRSPSSRTLAPTMSPPLFNSLAMTDNTLPPPYGDHINMSPLSDTGSEYASHAQSIRNKLNEQLSKSHKNSHASSDSWSFRSKDSKNDSISLKDAPSQQSDSISLRDTPLPENVSPQNNEVSIPTDTPFKTSHNSELGQKDIKASCANHEPEAPIDPISYREVDIADMEPRSRRSSACLSLYLKADLNDLHIDQTLPLLTVSTTTIYDQDPSTIRTQSITDLVTDFKLEDFHFNESLSHLRNPRIQKHYQEVAATEDYSYAPRERGRSFGVVMNEAET